MVNGQRQRKLTSLPEASAYGGEGEHLSKKTKTPGSTQNAPTSCKNICTCTDSLEWVLAYQHSYVSQLPPGIRQP